MRLCYEIMWCYENVFTMCRLRDYAMRLCGVKRLCGVMRWCSAMRLMWYCPVVLLNKCFM